jgi:lipoate-protein ligase A
VREHGINVARRISGGGTVFHDQGNVNFAFIKNVKSPAEISFKQFTAPVVNALAKLGVTATTSGRNDLLVDGLKISGNAEHVYKNRVLHHGTLLFNSDLEKLGKAIKVTPEKYEGKAVQSNRSPVANISLFLQNPMTIAEFIQFLLAVQLENPENKMYSFSESDVSATEKLATEKFRTWEWNFGYSPKYTFRNEVEIEGKTLSIKLVVEKGLIVEAEVGGDNFLDETNLRLSERLYNKRHIYNGIMKILAENFKEDSSELISVFF